MILPVSFYDRDALTVARALLGMRLVRVEEGQRIGGIITETEAYRGMEDLGCHAHSGKTKRNAVMFGPSGRAYVYFTYGMHWCLNFVTGSDGFPAAVLIRAVEPLEGLELIAARRAGRKTGDLVRWAGQADSGFWYNWRAKWGGCVQRGKRIVRGGGGKGGGRERHNHTKDRAEQCA